MKAPTNFSEKIRQHKIRTGPFPGDYVYSLGDDDGDNKCMWVYPQGNARNAIMVEFNWERENYVVKIVQRGDEDNFHTIMPTYDFPSNSIFKSFDNFNIWLIGRLEDFHQLFVYR